MTVRHKLLLGFGVLFCGIAASSGLLYWTARDTDTSHRRLSSLRDQLTDAYRIDFALEGYMASLAAGHDGREERTALLERITEARMTVDAVGDLGLSDEEGAEEEGEADRLAGVAWYVRNVEARPPRRFLAKAEELVHEIIVDETEESTAQERRAMQRSRRNRTLAAGTTLAGALVALSLLAWILPGLARRFGLLEAATRDLARGQYRRLPDDPGSDEIATLGRAFNVMLDELQENRAELVARNQSLTQTGEDLSKALHQLEEAQREIVASSRRAGMAEVAAGVLHNVGNVLNSVNVSVSLLTDGLRSLKTPRLQQALALVEPPAGQDLGTYLTTDPKGKNVLPYLHELANQLDADRQALLEQTDDMTKQVDHLKTVIDMQQQYAKGGGGGGGVREECDLPSVIEDALHLSAVEMEKAGIRVVREYALDEAVSVDRHRILQILVNLLSNAKHALLSADVQDRTIRLCTRETEDGELVIEVADNGVGVPVENAIKIFQHGFTTKETGHGFGLHASALAATEMGGSLTCASDGENGGACFRLALPRVATREAA
jgi:C4-dicarboxylate-specific signal transduction histidine kinase